MRLQRLEEEMHQLQDSAVLFEVVIPEFKYMKACRKELRMLKVNNSDTRNLCDHGSVTIRNYSKQCDSFSMKF